MDQQQGGPHHGAQQHAPYGGVPPAHPQAQVYNIQPAPVYAVATPAPQPSYSKTA